MSHEHSHQGCPCCAEGCHQQCECPCHGSQCHTHEHDDFAHQLLEMADEAWMEVLKEKIKKHIETSKGSQLDGLAKLVSESNEARWQHKMAKQNVCDDYKEKLGEFFKKK